MKETGRRLGMSDSHMLVLDRVALRLPEFGLTDISFRVARGEYCVVLGPTGSGKTVLLEMVCGLRRPDEGSIILDGADVTAWDPAPRRIGYVPQDHALLPFKSVRDNVGFGLAARRMRAAEIEESVDRMLALLGVSHLAARTPVGLSGGERQRVALARALAIEPKLLLLDEPLAAIDEETREGLVAEIRDLHARTGATTLHVCHSLEEAMALADRLAILREGRIVQVGRPEEVLARPADLFVAGFLRLKNLLQGEVRAHGGERAFFVGGVCVCPASLSPGPAVGVVPIDLVRVSRSRPAEASEWAVLEARVAPGLPQAYRAELRLAGPGDLAIPGIFPPDDWPPGAVAYLSIPRTALHLLPG